MRKDVRVLVDERQEFTFDLVGDEPMAADAARQWLDEQFTQMDCEPLRATGKLLLADKVLVVARDAGPRLLNDAAWGTQFARAASAVLGKPVVVVDLSSMAISY